MQLRWGYETNKTILELFLLQAVLKHLYSSMFVFNTWDLLLSI